MTLQITVIHQGGLLNSDIVIVTPLESPRQFHNFHLHRWHCLVMQVGHHLNRFGPKFSSLRRRKCILWRLCWRSLWTRSCRHHRSSAEASMFSLDLRSEKGKSFKHVFDNKLIHRTQACVVNCNCNMIAGDGGVEVGLSTLLNRSISYPASCHSRGNIYSDESHSPLNSSSKRFESLKLSEYGSCRNRRRIVKIGASV